MLLVELSCFHVPYFGYSSEHGQQQQKSSISFSLFRHQYSVIMSSVLMYSSFISLLLFICYSPFSVYCSFVFISLLSFFVYQSSVVLVFRFLLFFCYQSSVVLLFSFLLFFCYQSFVVLLFSLLLFSFYQSSVVLRFSVFC